MIQWLNYTVDPTEIGLESFGKPGNYVEAGFEMAKQYIDSETETIESMNNLIEWLPFQFTHREEN